MSSNPTKPDSIFATAIAKKTLEERVGYLDDACRGDSELRTRVEQMIDEHEAKGVATEAEDDFIPTLDAVSDGFQPGSHPSATNDSVEPLGTRIGPYKLLHKLGQGGMGAVFMAEQKEPVRRRVALKIIKPGMDTEHVIARFEAERQALALMNHNNIARVLDAGTTDSGRPYFVMELVTGVPITQYCDEHKLTVNARLQLFKPVCQAIQHAHQKGIIHRDIKPSNVLVCTYDDVAVPKVIDFGIAKATGQQLTDHTMVTEVGQIIGTLEYMSPEQAETNQLDIDTRSDVYSMGVLLYELLTGSTPFSTKQLRKVGLTEMLRTIREADPPKPSTRISEHPQSLTAISEVRQIEPTKLSKIVRGDLDWIVMRALEKDRTRRYESVSGLSADIERFLNNETVLACPPSARYRFQKFARRNKTLLATAASICVILIACTIVSVSLAVWAGEQQAIAVKERDDKELARQQAVDLASEARAAAQRERIAKAEEKVQREKAEALALAEQQAREEESRLRVIAEEERKSAEAVSKYLVGIFRTPDPSISGRNVTLAAILDRSVKDMGRLSKNRPETKALLLNAVGVSYVGLGLYKEAVPVHEQALALRLKHLGEDDPKTLISLSNLAVAYRETGEIHKAIEMLERATRQRENQLGASHKSTINSIAELGHACFEAHEYDRAIELLKRAIDLAQEKWGKNNSNTLMFMGNLAAVYLSSGESKKALEQLQEVLPLRKKLKGAMHPDTLATAQNLAQAYRQDKQYNKAIALYQDTIKRMYAVLGKDHSLTIGALNNLASVYREAKQPAQAVPLFKEAIKRQRKVMGDEHADTLTMIANLAFTYHELERPEEALLILEPTKKAMEPKISQLPGHKLRSLFSIAASYQMVVGREKGGPFLKAVVDQMQIVLGKQHSESKMAADYLKKAALEK